MAASHTQPSPSFPDIGVICLVPDAWQDPWQPRHHVLSRLAKHFHVVWIEPAHGWRETRSVPPVQPGHFEVYTPEWWLPKLHKPHCLATGLERARLWRAYHKLKHKGCRKIVLYLWRPEHASALDAVPHDMSCYHIDDEYTFSPVEQPTSDQEIHILQRVDHVFIHSKGLFVKKGHINPHSLLIPNGVDYEKFSAHTTEPTDLHSIPSPRVGYVGYIKTQLNFRLLLELAHLHPEWSLVFVGPEGFLTPGDRALVTQLASCANVYFLGMKLVDTLPAYTQGMDVTIMPYEMNDYTKFIFPMKLHEYLATGRPTIGSPIQSLQQFEHVVVLASTTDEWSHAISQALGSEARSEERAAIRRHVAELYDWSLLVLKIADTICAEFEKPLPSKSIETIMAKCVD